MIKAGEVWPEGCIYEPCSDISTNWMNILSEFGNITLYTILLDRCFNKILTFNLAYRLEGLK